MPDLPGPSWEPAAAPAVEFADQRAAEPTGMARLAVSTTHPGAGLDAAATAGDLSAVRFCAGPDGVRIAAA